MSTMLDHVSAARVEFENLLIAEIIAGSTIAGSPAAVWARGLRHGVCHCALHKREAVVWRCSRPIRATVVGSGQVPLWSADRISLLRSLWRWGAQGWSGGGECHFVCGANIVAVPPPARVKAWQSNLMPLDSRSPSSSFALNARLALDGPGAYLVRRDAGEDVPRSDSWSLVIALAVCNGPQVSCSIRFGSHLKAHRRAKVAGFSNCRSN